MRDAKTSVRCTETRGTDALEIVEPSLLSEPILEAQRPNLIRHHLRRRVLKICLRPEQEHQPYERKRGAP